MNSFIDLFLHWAHLTAAAVWTGSAVFFAAAVSPVLRRHLPLPQRAAVMDDLGRRYRKIGWASLAVLAATGFLKQRWLLGSLDYWRSGHGFLLAEKIGLVLLVMALTYLHDVRWSPARRTAAVDPDSPAYKKALRAVVWSGWAVLGLSLAVLWMAARLRLGRF